MTSTGRNCICRWGWLAPECSPELKNANNEQSAAFPPLCWSLFSISHQFLRQVSVQKRSFSSSKPVCGLFCIVDSMKWLDMFSQVCGPNFFVETYFSITGYLLSTILWVGLVAGSLVTSNSSDGSSKGLNFFFLLVFSPVSSPVVGFDESAGQ